MPNNFKLPIKQEKKTKLFNVVNGLLKYTSSLKF